MSQGLRFELEWLDGHGVRTAELAATWCRLQIEADGRPVTLVEDQRTGVTRKGVYCSAYPLAEWMATSWWALRSHVRPSSRGLHAFGDGSESQRWHDVRSASDGFAWPNLSIFPAGDATELVWVADHVSRGVLQYLTSGKTWLDTAVVQAAMTAFVQAVVDRLTAEGITESPLQDEWSAIGQANEDEASFCDAAAALGLDPYSLDDADAAAIQKIEATVGLELANELAAVSDASSLLDDLRWTTSSIQKLGEVGTSDGRMLTLASVVQDGRAAGGGPPWEAGYERARATRGELGVASIEAVDLTGIVSVAPAVLGRNAALHGLAGAHGTTVRVVPSTRASGAAQRFVQGRALHSALRRPFRPNVISAVHTWEAQVERAFAAELLAPARGIAENIKYRGEYVSAAEADALAAHFGAPRPVIEHQLRNQLQLAVAD